MIEGLTYFGGHSNDDLKSIGFVFEPNFFTIYFYTDLESHQIAGYRTFHSDENFADIELNHLKANFALSFTSDWTLIPQSVFHEDDAVKFLQFNTASENNQVEWERLIGFEAVLIYEPNSVAEQKLETVFPGLQLKHGIGSLLEFCRNHQQKSTQISSFLHQSEDRYSLAIFNADHLLFANTIQAKHDEDVRYFVLYTFKTLNLDPGHPVFLLGGAMKNEGLKKNLGIYLSKMETTIFLNNEDVPGVKSELNAGHWPGIFAQTCAL